LIVPVTYSASPRHLQGDKLKSVSARLAYRLSRTVRHCLLSKNSSDVGGVEFTT